MLSEVTEVINSLKNMPLLAGSNGSRLNNNRLGTLPIGYLFTTKRHFKMSKIRVIEIYPLSLDQVMEESTHSLLTLTPIW
jgi:hypothetical protein